MDIKITSKRVEVTPAIEDYAQKKLEKFTRYFDRVQQVEMVIDRAKNGFEIEILTDVEHHEAFVANSSDEDLYACIDSCVDRAVRQLTDHKSRLRDRPHKTPSSGHKE